MDKCLKRKSEFSSAQAAANKIGDLKRKKLLESALGNANNVARDSSRTLPRSLGVLCGNKRIVCRPIITGGSPNVLSILNKKVPMQDNIENEGLGGKKRGVCPSKRSSSSQNISSTEKRQDAVQEDIANEEPRLGSETTMQPNDLNGSARNGNEESTEHRRGMTSNGNNVDRRGTTRGLHTQKYIRKTGEKPKIYIPEGINKAVGQNYCMFASEIGVRITLDAPMQVEGWAKISDDDKEDLYRKLANKVQLEMDQPHVRKSVEKRRHLRSNTLRFVQKHMNTTRE